LVDIGGDIPGKAKRGQQALAAFVNPHCGTHTSRQTWDISLCEGERRDLPQHVASRFKPSCGLPQLCDYRGLLYRRATEGVTEPNDLKASRRELSRSAKASC
jgi:hypothetical protein